MKEWSIVVIYVTLYLLKSLEHIIYVEARIASKTFEEPRILKV